ncbi:MAG: diaminohydroxyphosphoribosylaminopyrimidine deaminase [Chloroflexota bacterium]|jgi:diaminohydroxyphosphoribosylaminopyrimidine deaminase/5-amino-6-(5-phosphoribosylamino)uracil reductase|nr:diaminohydroxyphosphoribosylaminopyrimidine deaminase [Chloroflexota bacterium]
MPRDRPAVTWAFGVTLDGRVAAPDGTSRWISSRKARADVHRLRATHDAVLVGSGTARADDPHLGVRHGVGGRPIRVILDAEARIVRAGSRIADGSAPTIVVVAADADTGSLPPAVEALRVGRGPDGRLDLAELLAALRRRGVRTLLVEGGPTLAAAFLASGTVDRIVAYVAPVILGNGRPLVTLDDVTTIADARRFRTKEVTVLGGDVRILAVPRRSRAR